MRTAAYLMVKLGITLLTKFEQALDNGTIAIVPVADEISSRWKCVLLDESVRDIIATFTSQGLCRWRVCSTSFPPTWRKATQYIYRNLITKSWSFKGPIDRQKGICIFDLSQLLFMLRKRATTKSLTGLKPKSSGPLQVNIYEDQHW